MSIRNRGSESIGSSSGLTADATIDPDPPTVSIRVPPADELPYRYTKAVIGFSFSAPVINFIQQGTVAVTNATFQLAGFSSNADGDEYELEITIADDAMGDVSISVIENTVQLAATTVVSNNNITFQLTEFTPAPVLGPAHRTTDRFAFDTRHTALDIGGTTTICLEQYDFDMNPYLNAVITDTSQQGGAFVGFTDMIMAGTNLYGLLQIQKKRPVGDRLDPNVEAGAVLLHVDLTNNSCSILKTYEFVTQGARSFTLYNNEVYFVEGSAYSSRQSAAMGHLYKITPPDTITDLGLNWRSDEPIEENLFRGVHLKTISPIRVTGSKLNLITGYGLLDKLIVDRTDKSNLIDNWQWLEYSSESNRRVALLETNDRSGYDVLRELALITNSVIGFYNEQFFFINREPYRAETSASIPETGTVNTISYANANRVFPTSGNVLIGTEVFAYTGTTATTLTGVTRGQFGTSSNGNIGTMTPIIGVNHYLDVESGIAEDPINDFTITLTPHLYNLIEITYGTQNDKKHEAKNDTSITEFGEKRFTLHVPLTEHQRAWVEFIADILLARFSQIRYRVDMRLKSSFYLQLGDVILLEESESAFSDPVQVLGITHNSVDLTTRVICETV